jgi:hypothetical protein
MIPFLKSTSDHFRPIASDTRSPVAAVKKTSARAGFCNSARSFFTSSASKTSGVFFLLALCRTREQEWLKAPLPALQNRKPIDLIAEGKLRDLIVEFQRMREGQPL